MTMKFAAAAFAATSLIASPAVARDGQAYVGVEAGAMFVKDINASVSEPFDFGIPAIGPAAIGTLSHGESGYFDADLDTGFDADIVVGYDWGHVRTEVEIGYRRAKFDKIRADEDDFIFGGSNDAKGKISSRTVIINVLGDLPLGKGFVASAGPGLGFASIKANPKVRIFDDGPYTNLQSTKDVGWMLQGIVAVRKELTANLDAGIKYRYVRSDRRSYDSEIYGDVEARLKAHSVLATLSYSIGSPVAR